MSAHFTWRRAPSSALGLSALISHTLSSRVRACRSACRKHAGVSCPAKTREVARPLLSTSTFSALCTTTSNNRIHLWVFLAKFPLLTSMSSQPQDPSIKFAPLSTNSKKSIRRFLSFKSPKRPSTVSSSQHASVGPGAHEAQPSEK
ncbi:hypothetical protein DFH11DRAFT_1258695 [Phellopilus nigrolimitatus]|nr:hypothetical protein DFH11DRAFT_1258695 [Phellopilus nigrolimitatus]